MSWGRPDLAPLTQNHTVAWRDADLATMSMGTFGRVWTDVCMIVACFGVMCSYMVINADMLTSLMAAWFGIDGEGATRTYILCGMLGILVPLASVRHLNALRFGRCDGQGALGRNLSGRLCR